MNYYHYETKHTPASNPLIFPRNTTISSWTHDIEKCNECDENLIEECCNKCGEGVCISTKCCELFPHYHDSNFTICRQCSNEIEKKLLILVNHNDLRLLKQKINKRITKKQEKQSNKIK